MGRKFGYARVSTSTQCLDLQIERLIREGVAGPRIMTDKASGARADRPGLELLKLKVEKGDEVIVVKLDRLGRNTLDMLNLINWFDQAGVVVRFLDNGIATDGPMGRLIIQILAAVAEAERGRIMERINEGKQEAIEKGVVFGRKRTINDDEVLQYLRDGRGPTWIARKMKISRRSVYAVIQRNAHRKTIEGECQ